MFNGRLGVNIKKLDLQISELNDELKLLKKDNKYEITMEKLKDLTELRDKLAKSQDKDSDELSDAVVEMDTQIDELAKKLAHLSKDEEYSAKMQRLDDLTKIRCQLAESKLKGSNVKTTNTQIVISGLIQLSLMVAVLKHEQTDIITTKAFGMVTKLFRGV